MGGTGGTGTGGLGGLGGMGGTGATGGGGGSTCVDPGPEPNGTVALAASACGVNVSASSCNLTDCDSDGSTAFGGPWPPAQGVVDPSDIADYFTYHGSDTFGCVVDPTATTQQSGFRLCVFTHCPQGATTFNSCTAGTPATNPNGYPGCCTTAPGTVTVDYSCANSSDDSAQVYIRADEPTTSCSDYTIDYHF